MNSKILYLIAGLTLAANLTACGSPATNSQSAPESTPAMSKDKGDAMSKDKAGDAMSKDKGGDAMKQSPAPSKP